MLYIRYLVITWYLSYLPGMLNDDGSEGRTT